MSSFERWVGSEVGGYRLTALLGAGGMGAVFRAEGRGKVCALKLLTSLDDEARARFEREAQALARVSSHPHILSVASYAAEPIPYLACELIEGGSLRELIDAQPPDELLPWDRVRELLDGIASALAHIHAAGLVHRDVKPENILLREDGQPVLADFGLVRDELAASLTLSAVAMGTPRVMAPEQVSGERARIGPQTDIWALGVLLYELGVGRPPFLADTSAELASAILLRDPTRPGSLNGTLPLGFDELALACLEKDPERRLASAEAFRERLLALGGARPPRRPRLLIGALSLGLAALLGLALASSGGPSGADELAALRLAWSDLAPGYEVHLGRLMERSAGITTAPPASSEAAAQRFASGLRALAEATETPPASINELSRRGEALRLLSEGAPSGRGGDAFLAALAALTSQRWPEARRGFLAAEGWGGLPRWGEALVALQERRWEEALSALDELRGGPLRDEAARLRREVLTRAVVASALADPGAPVDEVLKWGHRLLAEADGLREQVAVFAPARAAIAAAFAEPAEDLAAQGRIYARLVEVAGVLPLTRPRASAALHDLRADACAQTDPARARFHRILACRAEPSRGLAPEDAVLPLSGRFCLRYALTAPGSEEREALYRELEELGHAGVFVVTQQPGPALQNYDSPAEVERAALARPFDPSWRFWPLSRKLELSESEPFEGHFARFSARRASYEALEALPGLDPILLDAIRVGLIRDLLRILPQDRSDGLAWVLIESGRIDRRHIREPDDLALDRINVALRLLRLGVSPPGVDLAAVIDAEVRAAIDATHRRVAIGAGGPQTNPPWAPLEPLEPEDLEWRLLQVQAAQAEGLLQTGRAEQALALLEPHLEANPDLMTIHDIVIRALIALGRKDEARRRIAAVPPSRKPKGRGAGLREGWRALLGD